MRRSERTRRLLLLAPAVAVTVAAATVAAGAAQAAPTGRTPAVHRLAASPPQLPYLAVQAAQIRDGSRTVGIAGLAGTPIALYKVEGGYVIRRLVGSTHQLVLVTNDGTRRVLVTRIEINSRVVVASQGARIVYTPVVDGSYRTVEVTALPHGALVDRRVFTEPAVPLAYRGRVLLRLGNGRVLWWRPTVRHTDQIRSDYLAQVADLTANQMSALNSVVSLPPRTSAGWTIGSDPIVFGAWSTDDRLVAGRENPDPEGADQGTLVAAEASDGTRVASPDLGDWTGEVVWEDGSHLLVTRVVGGSYVLQRCTLPGTTCEQVGTGSATRYGEYVLATRRTS